jgi:mannitol/fructose-specific phosphotransferase system IIA component (Ntr-type)
MKLASLLTPDQIVLEMHSEEHMDAIVELVDHLVKVEQLDSSLREEVVESLKTREEQVSTGIGYGVAIPHAFSENLDQVVTIFGRSSKGIDFEALDHCPVHFIVLFLVPKKDYHMHLQTLAAIAKMFTNCDVRQELAAAECRTEILNILAGKGSRNVA